MAVETYQEALTFIHERPRFKKKPTLDRMRLFLNRLGNPERGQHYIHITGTNGKGSVVAMTRQMLMDQGLTVGSFTSPFITRFNERIAINGHPISDQDLVHYTQRVEPVVNELDQELPEGGPTEFEIDTAIMFCYFADHNLDVVILEVGIGGTYDSTNVIENPAVIAIVTVGYDHMKYLGSTLAEIAQHKAGIIKDGVPVVVGNLPTEAQQVIQRTAAEHHSLLYQLGRNFQSELEVLHGIYPEIMYTGLQLHRERYRLSLAGDYQRVNCGVALTIVQLFMQEQGLNLDLREIRVALHNTKWPGRMELVNEEPLVILDGAHNLPGMQALVETIRNDLRSHQVYVLVAILADKQYDLMLGELASLSNVHITVTSFAGPSANRPSADLSSIVQTIPSYYPIQVVRDWQQALAYITTEISTDDVVLITGSLYFISDVRHLMLDEK
ncbi:folylpolyglutamate synthase/dihydrofolate synthase family protein [uncultured Limosilactobacillus sp.]|uniref:bifunctional folylpolyglutamate synthase/dihydrofolate synthase n=1 Tax=uncultured Limosilactobacillus sp. TaxID=2837629 RepID=UPI0025DCACEB|nr:folylpolyglutamate synthase/dihydrofolate synthase family protein [uncultured Limosilactobacillus sp.]